MSSLKVTRAQEEMQTLKKFIENQGIDFVQELVIIDRSKLREPCDMSYKGIEYQITYGNRKQLGDIRKTISDEGKYCGISGLPPIADYVKEVLETALEDKKDKSDEKMTLLIEPAYTSYGLFHEEGDVAFKKYFKDNEQRIGGLWQHIFVVFSGGNIQLR